MFGPAKCFKRFRKPNLDAAVLRLAHAINGLDERTFLAVISYCDRLGGNAGFHEEVMHCPCPTPGHGHTLFVGISRVGIPLDEEEIGMARSSQLHEICEDAPVVFVELIAAIFIEKRERPLRNAGFERRGSSVRARRDGKGHKKKGHPG